MEKIDRLVWAEGFTFNSYGVRVGVRINRSGYLDRFAPFLPPVWKHSSARLVDRVYSIIVGGEGSRAGVRLLNVVYANANRLARVAEFDRAMHAFESDLQLYVAESAPSRVFVHAGVVGWNGKAVLIAGRSFSGKTSLVAALVRAGATYYSDEYAVLDKLGRVHHYARPLAVRENGHLERPTRYQVEAIGGHAGVRPLQVGLVLVSEYASGAMWRPRCLSAGEGALALMANTVAARRQPEATLETLHRVVIDAPVFKGKRGEANQLVDFISRHLGRLEERPRG